MRLEACERPGEFRSPTSGSSTGRRTDTPRAILSATTGWSPHPCFRTFAIDHSSSRAIPDGIEGKSFFQKDAPDFVPEWVRTVRQWSEDPHREIDYIVCEDLESLLYVVNLGSIPLHMWGSRVASLERPDWCILDLDPKEAPFTDAEGCLSVAGFTAIVGRARSVRVNCLNHAGEPQEIRASGWYARILKHEIDHLNGVLYVDRMYPQTFMTLENYKRAWKDVPIQEIRRHLTEPS